MAPSEYIPGQCNIGANEIRRRRYFSFIGYFLFFAFLIIFIVFRVNPVLRLSLFFPALLQSINWLQVYHKFCVNFGMRGVYNMDNDSNVTKVEEKYKIIDRQRSVLIILEATLIALLAAAAGYLSYYVDLTKLFY